MGMLVYAYWLSRWAAASLQKFEATFFSDPWDKTPVPVLSPAQGWGVALESASKSWSAWHT
jgi:hypothetical protein